ncbi:MAG: type III PLP-dependent enzyme [Alphaproteobacteria bacterium]
MDDIVWGGLDRQYKNFSHDYDTLEQAVADLRPAKPLYVMFPEIIEATAARFAAAFPGTSMYAVKTNPDIVAVDAIIKGGITSFDAASLDEIALVKNRYPEAEIYFMHPVKAPEDIKSAYFDYGVKNFVLDCKDELFKILRETHLAQDLNLFIRVALPKNDSAMIDFSSKFGADRQEAIQLLQECRHVAANLGISFHVGTQTSDASKYANAVFYVHDLLDESGISIDMLNVGGGFPVPYADGQTICSVEACVEALSHALEACDMAHLPLLAEPGRYLVAQGAKLVARVELRKGDTLYINDGIYGGLFDACDWLGLQYPVSSISCDRAFNGDVQQYRLAGPTCDSLDMMNGPFVLPADIGMGDWVVFENCGAYSAAMRSNFNGFGHADTICIYSQDE